jgi:1,4-dihydroxy-2-naphthoyl-CoA hydrolase
MAPITRLPDVTPDYLNVRSQGSLIEWMGITFLTVDDGEVSANMEITANHMAPNGFLHAAGIVALADSTCGNATIAHLPDGAESFTTIELKSNHLGTARDGILHCVAKSKHLGRTTQVWDAEVTHQETGKTIALFRCTQMILWPRS